MQLLILILVFCCFPQNSSTDPPTPDTSWRRSRYIIDNRRNALFSKKPSTVLLHSQESPPPKGSGTYDFAQSFKTSLYPVERYHKDLSVEASISEPKFYQKYEENSLPRKIIKSYRLAERFDTRPNEYVGILENQKNASEVLDPRNFLPTEDDLGNDVASKVVTTTEKMLTWVPKEVLGSVPSTETTSKDQELKREESSSRGFDFGIPTTVSYPWEIAKTEQGNQIDNPNEKHVYETRIETVSYHQEVIFNPPKKQNWYRNEPVNYEHPEENYEEPEKNYEQTEENYEDASGSDNSQNKFGYVVEGTNYRKYRVEERTVDGFIVGEYGVVSHDDGSLRGVRYTADGNTNPKLIYETLIKFLSL